MSRPIYNVKHSYTGTGSLDEYTFDFKVEYASHVLVVVLDNNGDEYERVRGDDTTVFLSGITINNPLTSIGGKIHLIDPLPLNYKLYIILAFDAPTQSFEFRDKTSFTLRRFEDALDWVQGQIQRLAHRAKQALKIAESDNESTFNTELPPGITDQGGATLQVSHDATRFQFGPKFPDMTDKAGKVPVINDDEDGFEWGTIEPGSALAGEYRGYSARFNEDWDTLGVRDTLLQILDFSYAAPLVSLSASGSGTIREKGDPVTSSSLAATVTKRSDNISGILFKFNGVLVQNYPGPVGSTVQNHNWTGSFSDNSTFSVEVTDDGTSGGPTIVIASSSFTFVYPYYYGSGANSLTPAQVATLTKAIITSSATLNRVFSPTVGQYLYFAYPASYGVLTSILDENGFETIGDWTLTVANITGLNGTPVSYNIYKFNNAAGVALTTNYTFKR